jgi:hypothetical protein
MDSPTTAPQSNKTEIANYFEENIISLKGHYETRSFSTRNYLEKRMCYKIDTFTNQEYNGSISELYKEFNLLVSSFSNIELEDFIRITCVQDIMVFNRIMLDSVKISGETGFFSVASFIERYKNEYEQNYNKCVNGLSMNAKDYIINSRLKFRHSLYLNSMVSSDEFYLVNKRYESLLCELQEGARKKFVEAIMYQDLKLICEYHLFNFQQ